MEFEPSLLILFSAPETLRHPDHHFQIIIQGVSLFHSQFCFCFIVGKNKIRDLVINVIMKDLNSFHFCKINEK